jgi:SAM-dependent methyltransferase
VSAPSLFDRKLLFARRARAARQGALSDFLLERAAGEIVERLDAVQRSFSRSLVLGAYHGLLTSMLAKAGQGNWIASMEASGRLLANCSGPKVQGDEEFLPFRNEAFDLIVSALSLHLVNDLPGALIQICRALKPDGLFLGALLGGRTLVELREAFMQAEMELEGGVSPRVAPMADLRDFGGLLQRAGFALPVADSDVVNVTYASPFALMSDLRGMGAANALSERRKRPLRRETLRRAVEIYGEIFSNEAGRINATFEIVYLAGWAPHESQQKPLKPGSAAARLADVLGVEEHRLKKGN